VRHFECDGFFAHAIGLLLSQNRASDKITFVQRDKKSEASFDGCCLFIQLVAVKWVTSFGAQRVARAEAAGFDSEWFSGFEQCLPYLLDGFVVADNFKTIFTRVTGSGNQNIATVKKKTADLIFLQLRYAGHSCRAVRSG